MARSTPPAVAGKRGVPDERIVGDSTRLRTASLRTLGTFEMAGRFSVFPRRGKPLRFGRFELSGTRTGGLLRTVPALPGRALSIRGVWTRGISIRRLACGALARTLGPLERLTLPRLADGKRTLPPLLRMEGGALRTDGATLRLLPRLRRLLLPPLLRTEGMLRLMPPLLMRGPLLRMALPELRDMPPPERMELPPLERAALPPPPR